MYLVDTYSQSGSLNFVTVAVVLVLPFCQKQISPSTYAMLVFLPAVSALLSFLHFLHLRGISNSSCALSSWLTVYTVIVQVE